jgi:two-component system nitrogen regulation response regulator NtrX
LNEQSFPIKILIIDDETQILTLLSEVLKEAGYTILLAKNATEGLARFQEVRPDLVLLDLKLPDGDGLDVLKRMREKVPDALVVIMSGFGTIATAIEALRRGAYDFIEKPLEQNRVLVTVRNALDRKAMEHTAHRLKDEVSERYQIIGSSPRVHELLDLVSRVAPAQATVLITGESGSGKELVARAIHRQSPRALGPFVKMNCAAVPHELIESEFFGYEKGAFTGASNKKSGQFALAQGGSLFLDEVGDMSLSMQAKMLRVLEDKEIVPLGGGDPLKVDVRLIAATNKDLANEVREGNFREDLLHRLSVLVIMVPPLRERKEDILPFCEYFLALFAAENNLPPRRLTPEAQSMLIDHPWPGNVRELRNLMERLTILSPPENLDASLISASLLVRAEPPVSVQTLSCARDSSERSHILATLNAHHWEMEATANALGIHRSSLFRKLKRLGIEKQGKL